MVDVATTMIHGTNHSNTPAGVSLARRCPSLLKANQSIEDTLKFKIAKWCTRRESAVFSSEALMEDWTCPGGNALR
jgi:L-serine deaminase